MVLNYKSNYLFKSITKGGNLYDEAKTTKQQAYRNPSNPETEILLQYLLQK